MHAGKSRWRCGEGKGAGRDFHVRGTNLGGWLVLEPWITPSLFYQFLGASERFGNDAPQKIGMDMWSFCRGLGPEEANRQLRRHWETWVTEKDIAAIAATGADSIRIPVGDWMYIPYEPYTNCTTGALEELDRVLDLAAKYDLKVLLDIHAVRGSQNGFDNSGQTQDIVYTSIAQIVPIRTTTFLHWPTRAANWIGTWDRNLGNYTSINYDNLENTLAVIDIMVDMYKDVPVVWGIEPVNEPWEFTPMEILFQFYWDAYQMVRAKAPHWIFLMHDSFHLDPWFWDGYMEGCPNVGIDTHIYQVTDARFGRSLRKSACLVSDSPMLFVSRPGTIQRLRRTSIRTRAIWETSSSHWPVVTGEWSLATDNCAMWLNGFQDNLPGFPKVVCRRVLCPRPYMGPDQPGAPPSRDIGPQDPFGTGASTPMWGYCPIGESWDDRGFSDDAVMRELGFRKIYAFDQIGNGWYFWNFKTELEPRWDFMEAWRRIWIPVELETVDTNTRVVRACDPIIASSAPVLLSAAPATSFLGQGGSLWLYTLGGCLVVLLGMLYVRALRRNGGRYEALDDI
eukprot:scaffold1638_cov258-Pinguiococcus_pyrenoidosus.AAC.74